MPESRMHLPRLTLLVAVLVTGPALAQDTSYYVEAGSYATQRESDPPGYVRNLGQAGHAGLDWLDLGLQQRFRYEYRDDDIRRLNAEGLDDPWLSRTRLYLGVRNRIDPLRFAVEFQDSRRYASRYAPDNRDVNKAEFIQGYAELYFADAMGADPRGNKRPLSIRYGRHAFELLDRRLVGRNEWRNTTNTFEGLRASLGQDSNDWQLEFMRFHPVTRLLEEADSADRALRFSALIGHWRGSPRVTVEPHYFRLQQDASPANGNRERDIHAPGLRVYGKSADTALNYDVSLMAQFGDEAALDHQAWSVTAETGYTWLQHPWRPRFSAFYGYASGDRNPADSESNRFERFFGFARPWSANDYVIYENLHAPKLRVEFQPIRGLRVDAGYSAYWLASDRDRFNNLMTGTAFNRDTRGQSGDFVGQEFDARARFAIGEYLDVTLGYAHFATGEFIRNRQRAALGDSAADTDFVYVELMFSLF
jgi:hypothetical protein